MTVLNTALVSQIVDPLFLSGLDLELRPQVQVLNLARVLPARRRTGQFTVPPAITSPPTVGWLGEGESKPVSTIAFEREVVQMRKLASIVPVTDELVQDSAIGVIEMIRQALIRAGAIEVDSKLLSGVGGTDVEPLGILNQTSSLQTVTFSAIANLDTLMEEMVLLLRNANFRPTAWLMHETVLHSLQVAKDLDGRPRYPETRVPGGGSFMSIPIRTSNNVPTSPTTDGVSSPVILADWRQVEVYAAPSSISISDVATIDDGGTLRHLWQEDAQAVRFHQYISDPRIRRSGSVVVMENVEVALPS